MRATWSQSTARVRAWKASTLSRACSFTSSAKAWPTCVAPSAERRVTARSTSSAAPAVRCTASKPRRAVSSVRSIASRATSAPLSAVRLPSSATLSVAFSASLFLAVCAMTVPPLRYRSRQAAGPRCRSSMQMGSCCAAARGAGHGKAPHARTVTRRAELVVAGKMGSCKEVDEARLASRKGRRSRVSKKIAAVQNLVVCRRLLAPSADSPPRQGRGGRRTETTMNVEPVNPAALAATLTGTGGGRRGGTPWRKLRARAGEEGRSLPALREPRRLDDRDPDGLDLGRGDPLGPARRHARGAAGRDRAGEGRGGLLGPGVDGPVAALLLLGQAEAERRDLPRGRRQRLGDE